VARDVDRLGGSLWILMYGIGLLLVVASEAKQSMDGCFAKEQRHSMDCFVAFGSSQ